MWKLFERKLRLQGNSEKTIITYKSHYNNMDKFVNGLTKDNIKTFDFDSFIGHYKSNSSKKHFRIFINRFNDLLDLGLNLKQLNSLKFVDIKKEKIIPTEVNSIINKAKSVTDKLILKMLAETGLRISELSGIEMDNIDFDNGVIKITNTKTHRDRVIAVGEDTLNLMKDYLKVRKPVTNYFFVSNKGNKFSTDALRNRVGKYSEFTPHSFRHYFATDKIVNKQIPIPVVSRALGHANVTTTLNIYTHVVNDDVIKMMKG
jgi:integrase/recombinase XerD